MEREYQNKFRELGLKIAYYRKLRGMTQEQLAEAVGLSCVHQHVEAPVLIKPYHLARYLLLQKHLIFPLTNSLCLRMIFDLLF